MVLHELESAGIPAIEISIVASNAENWYSGKGTPPSSTKHDRDRDGVDDRAEGAAAGAGIGATAGGIAGLLAGLGMIAIPGSGSRRSGMACLRGSCSRSWRCCRRHPRAP
jgi:hypothetical protein